MKTLVISHTAHHRRDDGELVGWGATVRELDHLATLFDELVHLAFLHDEPAPPSGRPYANDRISFRPLTPAGGGVLGKLAILYRTPGWVRAMLQELRRADAVHVRCPANVSLIALLVLTVVRRPRPRWIKYAGNWSPSGRDATSYRAQRWLLRRNLPRGAVTVNGRWPGQPSHIHSFDNPCLTDDELAAARAAASDKVFDGTLRILFAGRLDDAKGAGRALEVAEHLAAAGVPFHLDLAGDGPDRRRYERFVAERGLDAHVTFHGWLGREDLDVRYRHAHAFLLLSSSEGFPKVIAEAMAHGAVTVASHVSSIPQVLAETGGGTTVAADDVLGAVSALKGLSDPETWRTRSRAASAGAERFTYRTYLSAVRGLPWDGAMVFSRISEDGSGG